MLKQTLLIIGASLLLSACGKGGISDFSAPENIAVAELFEKGCVRCHGSDGGGMLFGLMFALEPQGKSATELATTILSGREKMPAFAALSEKQRMALANHILVLRNTEAK
jgi:mono/diheme cytochrome c family protein